MGLDMYLKRKIYIGANYEHNKVEGKIEITKGTDKTPIKIDLKKVSEIEEQIGYWRKANQIHNWFVENVQEGKDDCGEYYVSRDNLKELLDVCLKIKEIVKYKEGDILISTTWTGGKETKHYRRGQIISNSEEIAKLLPSSHGFFFGSTDYDEYYIQDIDNTIDIIQEALENTEGDIYYEASW